MSGEISLEVSLAKSLIARYGTKSAVVLMFVAVSLMWLGARIHLFREWYQIGTVLAIVAGVAYHVSVRYRLEGSYE